MKTNYLINADNLRTMQALPDDCIDLIYCDPPFNTGRDFGEGSYTDKHPSTQKAENLALEHRHFQWLNRVASPSQKSYFSTIIPRLIEIERILKPTGALYWHCDYKTSAHVRLILNLIFGQNRFRNEIAWMYKISMPFDTIKNIWKNNYDVIFFYAGKDHAFQAQFHSLTYKQIKEMYPYTDSEGRKYRYKDGLYSGRIYADDNKGTRIGTAWTDIPIASAKERTGYPTQKPMSLLRRIISASSQEGDIVCDPYSGSGTTLLVAKQMKRQYIGIDQNAEAIFIAEGRLK